MRAISLHQPWASAIAYGAKRVETRSWSTDYRGPLAIHAARRFVFEEMVHYRSCWNWMAAVPPLRGNCPPGDNGKVVVGKPYVDWVSAQLPWGAIVAICEIADCRETGSFTVEELETRRFHAGREKENSDLYSWTEKMMGDFSLGRYGWILKNVRRLKMPIPMIGRQRFFQVEIPDSVEFTTLPECIRGNGLMCGCAECVRKMGPIAPGNIGKKWPMAVQPNYPVREG